MDKVYNTESAKTDLFSSITRDSHGGEGERDGGGGGGFRLSEIQAVDQFDFLVPFERGFLDIASIDRSIDRVALNVLASDFSMTTLYIFLIELIVSG